MNPSQHFEDKILDALKSSEEPLSILQLQEKFNLDKRKLELVLTNLCNNHVLASKEVTINGDDGKKTLVEVYWLLNPDKETDQDEKDRQEIEKAKAELARIEKEFADLNANESTNSNEIDQYIDQLHKYNDLKDLGVRLLGVLAIREGTTTAAMYERYDLNLND